MAQYLSGLLRTYQSTTIATYQSQVWASGFVSSQKGKMKGLRLNSLFGVYPEGFILKLLRRDVDSPQLIEMLRIF
ncbi:MAG: hypothetical protein B1H12_08850 [Desulfobacteraceae bacterium 4484_190.2]|nr:MAG: hypothetical protein B1H12_08850 [Desulfobacteraceae bacterium 4484_190.2]